MSDLMDDFNELSGEKYAYLRLSSVNVEVKNQTAEFVLVYPEDKEEEVRSNAEEIRRSIVRAAGTKLNVKIKLKKSHFDRDHFIYEMLAFLDEHPSVRHVITNRDFNVEEEGEHKRITLSVPAPACDYLRDSAIAREMDAFIKRNYLEAVELAVIASDRPIDYEDEEETRLRYEQEGGRLIQTQNNDALYGDVIYDKAAYIIDVKPAKEVVLCGKISSFKEYERRPKNEEDKGGRYFKFTLTDPTGSIGCIVFPRKNCADRIGLLIDGKEIIASGDVELNSFRDQESLVFKIRRISYCSLPQDFVVNRIVSEVNKEYRFVFPRPYVSYEQEDVFARAEETPPYLKGKTFCVYDIETTGLIPAVDEIIEISAVKIENGVLTEVFSSLVDPQRPITEAITKLTGIAAADVAGAPIIGEVMPDFFKFSYGTIMVGQNSIAFDYPFISMKARRHHIYFDNPQLDTMVLAKRYLPHLSKFNLGVLTKYFGIVNDTAHRALSDAVATAKVFMKLAIYIKN